MGVVYKAHDPTLDRLVAIKVLAPHLTWDQQFVQRFRQEARAVARLKHPNIVAIHDVGQVENYHFIVMDYLEGQPLSTLIHREGPLPPERAAHLVTQIAKALDHAHARGVIHRDVKPGNVIVSPRGHVTLTDFGLAKAMAGTQLTRSGTLLGTPAYMSPEQVKGENLTPATDIYSLGIVAYELLAGRAPFEADSSHAILHAQVYEPPPPLKQAPPAVQKAVLKALGKRPDERWHTAGAFAQALTSAAQGEKGAEQTMLQSVKLLGAGLVVVILLAVAAFAVSRFTGGSATLVPLGSAVVTGSTSTPRPEIAKVPPAATTAPTSSPKPPVAPELTEPVADVTALTPVPTATKALPTATRLPTSTPKPTEPTRTPTRAPTPTPIPVPMRTPVSPTPASAAVMLLAPDDGARVQGNVAFQWTWANALGPGEIFDVRVCKGEGCLPQFGKTNVGETTYVWQPDEGEGPYRWQVVVIHRQGDHTMDRASSSVWRFDWSGGSPPQPRPTPTR